jgi:hypothetical protein
LIATRPAAGVVTGQLRRVARRTSTPPPSISTPTSAAVQALNPLNGSCLPGGSPWLAVVPLAVDAVDAVVAVVALEVAVELVLDAAVELGVEDDVLELDEPELTGADDEPVELPLWVEL